MEKAVLISIRPEWCERIACGVKTIEVRKSRPKIEAPFRCYIYCTMPKTKDPHQVLEIHGLDEKIRKANGKVIGEFVCKGTPAYWTSNPEDFEELCAKGCLSVDDLYEYAGDREWLFGWRISNLVIYDKPKELGEFRIPCKEYERANPGCGGCDYYRSMGEYPAECDCDGLKPVTRAPQSWCYVEPITT